MVQRYELELYHCNGGEMEPCDEGGYVEYEDYAKLKSKFNDILDMLDKLGDDLGNDLGYGVILDEYAYDRVGEILRKYRNEPRN